MYVVSPDPDVSSYTVDLSKHRYIILASDGLWNMVKPQEAVNVVKQLDEQVTEFVNKPATRSGLSSKFLMLKNNLCSLPEKKTRLLLFTFAPLFLKL